MNRARNRLGLGLGALVALAACFFSFENPIELQANNTLAGTVVVSDARCGGDVSNVRVTILWSSGYGGNVSSNGKFVISGLPDGVYNLRYDYFDPDAGADAGATCSGLQPNVELPRLFDQSSDALDLGTFTLQPSVTLTGFVDAGGPVVVGAFAPDAPGAPGAFESYATASDPFGNFSFKLPPGHHVVWVSSPDHSAPIDLILDGGVDLDLGLVTLFSPDSGVTTGFVQGNIVLGGFGAGADGGAIAALFGIDGTNFEINPPQMLPFSLTGQIPGLGAQMTQPLPPGGLLDVFCGLKDESGLPSGTVFNDLKLPGIPAFAGRSTTLGQITWISNPQFLDAGLTPPGDYSGSADAGLDAGVDGGADAGPSDAGLDAGPDAGADGGVDAGADAGPDAGLDAGPVVIDAGPPEWRLLGTVTLPIDSGIEPASVVPVDFDGGRGVFFDQQYDGVFFALAVDGGYGPPLQVDSSQQVFGAIADARGLPLGLVGIDDSDVVSFLLCPQADGSWLDLAPINDAGFATAPYGTGNLIPADNRRPNAWGVAASAYYVFPDPNSQQAIDLATFVPPAGPLQIVASYPFVDGGYTYGTSTAPCRVNGHAGLCVVVTSEEVCIMSIDLETGVATQPYQVQQSANPYPSAVSAQAIPDAGILVGWVESNPNASSYPIVWMPALPEAAFACDPTSVVCPIPPQFSVAGLGNAYLDLLINSEGAPFAIFSYSDAGFTQEGFSPVSEFAVDLEDLAYLDLPGAEYLPTPAGGFTDDQGHPVIGVVGDAGGVAAVQVFTYY